MSSLLYVQFPDIGIKRFSAIFLLIDFLSSLRIFTGCIPYPFIPETGCTLNFSISWTFGTTAKDEKDFSRQALPFLAGVLSPIKNSFERFGVDISIEREKIISERERIDLLITVGRARIGVELKYNPTKMSEFDHLMSQIDRYSPCVDHLIIVSYSPLESWAIKKIKEKEIEKGIPIRIVTPNKVI